MNQYTGKVLDGRYEIRELLGIGGMADVYSALDMTEDRIVAVKILKQEYLQNDDFKRRFRNESKAIAVLSHPNIVKIFDVSFGESIQYIVMEFVDGITLKEYIEQQEVVEWREALHFVVQILRALQHAHDNGIVHRDVKPQNVMLLEDGTVKVMDFGIARFARDHGRTISDKAIGSVHYISPEQARGDVTDERGDIYAVGVLLFEMLTGKLPFDGDTPVSIAVKQMQEEAPLPTSINPNVPRGMEEIIIRAMQKDPDLRYQTGSEMLRDLDEFKRNPAVIFDYQYLVDVEATQYLDPVSAQAQLVDDDEEDVPKKRRSPSLQILVAVASACVLVALAAVVYFLMDLKDPTPEFNMYDLVGLKYEDIKDDPNYNKVKLVVGSEELSEEYEAGVIMSHTPVANTRIKEGSKVTLVVSIGLAVTNMPDYVNQDKEEIKIKLEKMGFKVSLIGDSSDSISKDNIIKTDPAEGKSIRVGQRIVLYYSTGKDTANIKVPDLSDMTESQATRALKALGLSPSFADKASTATKGTIISQDPEPGTTVKKNSIVVAYVSTGKAASKNVSFSIGFSGNPVDKKLTFTIYLDGEKVDSVSLNPSKDSFSWSYKSSGSKQAVVKVNGSTFAIVNMDFTNGKATIVSTNQSVIQGEETSKPTVSSKPTASSKPTVSSKPPVEPSKPAPEPSKPAPEPSTPAPEPSVPAPEPSVPAPTESVETPVSMPEGVG